MESKGKKMSTTWKRDVMDVIDEFRWKRIENQPTYMRFEFKDAEQCRLMGDQLERCGFIVERNPITMTVRPEPDGTLTKL